MALLLRRHQQHRLLAPILRPDALEGGNLGQVVIDDIGIGRITDQEILVIVLGPVEALERLDLGGDGAGENLRRVELGDIGPRRRGLGRRGRENSGAIAGAGRRRSRR